MRLVSCASGRRPQLPHERCKQCKRSRYQSLSTPLEKKSRQKIKKIELGSFCIAQLLIHPSDMLSESLIASVLGSTKTQTSSTLKDVGICVQELQPASALRSTFKKSSTAPNGLAVTPTHVFAAQVDKSVVHVYSRLRGNQEATVPFPERIRSLAVAGRHNGELLILGTEGGRLILWEVR
jgi:hypothetical protein